MLKNPPFCPNPDCKYHHRSALSSHSSRSWYRKNGRYKTKNFGRIQRFICKTCGTQFSSRTFSIDYGIKKKIPCRRIFEQMNAGSGLRSLARNLGVSEKVIINRLGRLAHQAIGIHAVLRPSCPVKENLVTDGFESFVVSQYFPNNIHLLVGKNSQYLYGADYAHIRRKGRMQDKQKQKRSELEQIFRPPKGDITRSFTRIIRQLIEYTQSAHQWSLTLFSDEKTEYRNVLKGVLTEQTDIHGRLPVIEHLTVSSRIARTVKNDLFPVNYYDREIRKDQGNHVRETVQFSRNVNNCMERLWVYSAYHNYMKPFRIGKIRSKGKSHGMEAGIPFGKIQKELGRFFTRRYFVTRLSLTVSEWYSWFRCYKTPLKAMAETLPEYMCA